jgi:nicotinate-nucleotide--dimethylbenzimidazole phosphoribosyltransferase
VAGAIVTAVAVGVATPWVPSSRILDRTVRAGTDDLAEGPAMSVVEARRALAVGAQVAQELIAGGANALVTGDLGIGNTTPSAALVAAFTGCSAAEVTGRGTSTDDSTLARKVAVVARAVDRLRGQLSVADGAPIENDDEAATTALAGVGGLEHAALTGFIIGGAAARVPVVIDGLAAGAAALVAHAMAPWVVPYLIAGHRSVEPGASGALAHLGLDPIIDLDLRLGEGTGALLAVPVVQSAAVVMHRMATLREVGAVPDDERGI